MVVAPSLIFTYRRFYANIPTNCGDGALFKRERGIKYMRTAAHGCIHFQKKVYDDHGCKAIKRDIISYNASVFDA